MNEAVWDSGILRDWRKYTGDPRTFLDGTRLAWCKTCHKISDGNLKSFVMPTKEVREILTKLGVKVMQKTMEVANEHGSA